MTSNSKFAILSLVGSAIVSAAVAFAFQIWGDSIAHDRAARLQIALEFTAADDNLIPIATRYINTVAIGGSTSEIQNELRSHLAKEIARADHLKSSFHSSADAILAYQEALQALAQSIEAASNPVQMRAWVEAFGRVVDARQQLDARLKEAARA